MIQRGQQVELRHGVCLWSVLLKSDDTLIGHCGFHPCSKSSGLELAPPLIIAVADAENTVSWRVLEKIGMRNAKPTPQDGSRARRYELSGT